MRLTRTVFDVRIEAADAVTEAKRRRSGVG